MSGVRDKINDYFVRVEEIEKNVNLQISKIDISYLKETDYRIYL